MTKKINVFLFITTFIITNKLSSQVLMEPEDYPTVVNLYALGKSYGDSIVIRWAPEKYSIFEGGKKEGYQIQRRKLYSGDTTFKVIADKVMPYTEEQWLSTSESLERRLGYPDTNYIYASSIFFSNIKDYRTENSSFIEMNQNLMNAYAMLLIAASRSKDIAKSTGLYFTDYNIEENTDYEYRIVYLGKTAYYIVGNTAIINSKKFYMPSVDYNIVGLEESIAITFHDNDYITAYTIDRRTSRSDPWMRLTPVPMSNLYNGTQDDDTVFRYLDTFQLINNEKQYYQVIGYDGFGDEYILFEDKGMARDLTPPIRPLLKKPTQDKYGSIVLEWEAGKPLDNDLAGFNVYRSDAPFLDSGVWVKLNDELLKTYKTSFIDKRFTNNADNYYVIEAVDKSGNAKKCEPLYAYVKDLQAPKAPIWVEGLMDSLGNVKLKIRKNQEDDLMGYRVFLANDKDHEFSPFFESFKDSVSEIVDTVFYDTTTLNTLSKSIFYKVKALDFHYNESPFSKVLEVKRVDTVAPTSPSFTDIRTDIKSITLKFNPSKSEDLSTQYLYRRVEGDTNWTKIIKLDKKQSSYVDTNVIPNIRYYYSLRSEDFSGNKSELSFPVYSMTYNLNMQELVGTLNLNYNEDDKTITAFWNANVKSGTEYWYVLYKEKDGTLREYKNTQTTPSFTEKNVKKGTYTYAVKVFFKDGTESKISASKTITVDEW